MNLRDQVDIGCSPEKIWLVLEDPNNLPAWNPNVQRVGPITWGTPAKGFRYRATYVLRGKANEMDAEIEEFQPPVRLAVRLSGGRMPKGAFAREVYDLTPIPGGTRLVQTIELDRSGIPLVFRALMWFIQRFGKPTGKTFLATFKELVEAAEAPGRQV
ncbi:MAG: SRPBCC family protein [Nitrospirota bacterium]|nr:SRPBCC family protein [Nitrospirota bacterium]